MIPHAIGGAFAGGSRYVNTTNYGLLPVAAVERLQRSAAGLGDGSFDTATRDAALDAARRLFAGLVGAPHPNIAVGGNASSFVGLFANSLPDGTTVLVVEEDFTSLTMPFVVQRDRLRIVRVSVAEFVDAMTESIDVAAVSAVQSGDGTVLDLAAVARKREELNIRVILDATQATGWLPIGARDYDVVVAAAYKWLLCPRGVAFAYFSDHMIAAIRPILAGWYATENTHTGYYGTDVELAASARRFDTSPSGLNWLGAEPALRLLAECGVPAINRHNVALANHFLREVGLPESNSAIVSVPVSPDVVDSLTAGGVRFGLQNGKRAGYARFAFHLYNTEADAALVASSFRSR